MCSCWGKQRCILPAERSHVGIGAVEKDMLLILDVIGITQVTGGGITCRCLKTKRCYKVYKDYKERPSVKKCDC